MPKKSITEYTQAMNAIKSVSYDPNFKTTVTKNLTGFAPRPKKGMETEPFVETLKPRTVNLSSVPFGKELTWGFDKMWTQPRSYTAKQSYTTSDGTVSLNDINAGMSRFTAFNPNGPEFSGAFKAYPREKVYNSNLVALDRTYLNTKSTNFIYCMLYDTQAYAFYKDEQFGYSRPVSLNGSQYQVIPNAPPLNSTTIKKLDSFWTAFSLVRQYVTWAYYVIQNVEKTSSGGKSIGSEVRLVLDLESLYNGWYNGGCCLGGSPENPIFANEEEKNAHKTVLIEIIENIRTILSGPAAMIGLNFPIPPDMLGYWVDTAPYTSSEFIAEWTDFIMSLPAKYRTPKIGVYGIPDNYYFDADGNGVGDCGGWYGLDLKTDNQPKIWNYLSKASRDIINEKIVDLYADILDAVDFITPSVYIFEPLNQSCNCTKHWNFYALNSEGRNLHQQYAHDAVYRAVLYNKKYGKSKPIYPMLTTAYNLDAGAIYDDYCEKGNYRENSNDFVINRLIDNNTLKNQIKSCYEAVYNQPHKIEGFLWWTSSYPVSVQHFNNSNILHQEYPGYMKRRRLYNLNYDSTKDPNNNSLWQVDNYDALKITAVTKEFQVLNTLNNSSITIGGNAQAV